MTTQALSAVLLFALLIAAGYLARGAVDRWRHLAAHRAPRHATLDVGGIDIDAELAPIVSWAQHNGITTTCSCQDEDDAAYLKLTDPSDAYSLFQIIRRLPGIRRYGLYAEEPCAHPGAPTPEHEFEYIVMWDRAYTPALTSSLTSAR
ncbi:hypothetical protein [Brachybacterium paraconglomeratum]|uniref:hypothetical protein n=1 Tax=Brachybacterium paraconglomeratum TaxID=173362 RepID=UPI0022AFDCCD|nr:hypothetical protein [Brachybacterium paraconglomeratum]MCZ4326734.1 hypothetical protein [Brachybacterium paraconglomeratum]